MCCEPQGSHAQVSALTRTTYLSNTVRLGRSVDGDENELGLLDGAHDVRAEKEVLATALLHNVIEPRLQQHKGAITKTATTAPQTHTRAYKQKEKHVSRGVMCCGLFNMEKDELKRDME